MHQLVVFRSLCAVHVHCYVMATRAIQVELARAQLDLPSCALTACLLLYIIVLNKELQHLRSQLDSTNTDASQHLSFWPGLPTTAVDAPLRRELAPVKTSTAAATTAGEQSPLAGVGSDSDASTGSSLSSPSTPIRESEEQPQVAKPSTADSNSEPDSSAQPGDASQPLAKLLEQAAEFAAMKTADFLDMLRMHDCIPSTLCQFVDRAAALAEVCPADKWTVFEEMCKKLRKLQLLLESVQHFDLPDDTPSSEVCFRLSQLLERVKQKIRSLHLDFHRFEKRSAQAGLPSWLLLITPLVAQVKLACLRLGQLYLAAVTSEAASMKPESYSPASKLHCQRNRKNVLQKGVSFIRELQQFVGELDADTAAVVCEFEAIVQRAEADYRYLHRLALTCSSL